MAAANPACPAPTTTTRGSIRSLYPLRCTPATGHHTPGMNPDPKRLVRQGYDEIAPAFLAWPVDSTPAETRYLSLLAERLPRGARVLDLGCGSGLPWMRALAERFDVVGVDFSPSQLALAREHVPSARLVQGDMTDVAFHPRSFDAVGAFSSLIHVPRDEHEGVLRRAFEWLKPGGLLVVTMGTGDMPAGIEEDWLGAPMYWSGFDAETNRELVLRAGFEIESADVLITDEDGEPVDFLWIVARKPAH